MRGNPQSSLLGGACRAPSGRAIPGRGVLELETAWRDGTTHLVMGPLELMRRLAALILRPRPHLIRLPVCWRRTQSCGH